MADVVKKSKEGLKEVEQMESKWLTKAKQEASSRINGVKVKQMTWDENEGREF